MKRLFSLFAALTLGLVSLLSAMSPTAAQIDQIDPAFTNTVIGSFGLQTLEAQGATDGFTFSTETVATGMLHVVLSSPDGVTTYLDFMQMPEGLDPPAANEQALQMARDDIPSEGWTYGGGSYAFAGTTIEFLVSLTPGTWQIAASYQPDNGEEVMTLTPLTVREATPAPENPVTADVTLELQDVAFGMSADTVPTGPQIWNVTNTGEQPRQMVLFRTPRAFTSEDYLGFFQGMESGTPSPEFMEQVWVAYTAVASPGYGTWIELDLEPGTYTATSWVIDADTQAPALLLGMVESFTVE